MKPVLAWEREARYISRGSKHDGEFESASRPLKHVQSVQQGDKQSFKTCSRLSLGLKSFKAC